MKKTLAGLLLSALAWAAQGADIYIDVPFRQIVHKDGRHALLVDGKPFFMLAVAAAGKAELALPMYVNVALRDPLRHQEPTAYSAGGPTDNVIDVWKAGAPHIDVIGPDIYFPETPAYQAVLKLYDRPDNPLFVPETGREFRYARYLFDVMGRRGIGFSPFGVDFTSEANDPAAIPAGAWDKLQPFAGNYRLVAPIMRVWAQQAFAGQVWGTWRKAASTGTAGGCRTTCGTATRRITASVSRRCPGC